MRVQSFLYALLSSGKGGSRMVSMEGVGLRTSTQVFVFRIVAGAMRGGWCFDLQCQHVSSVCVLALARVDDGTY